jgi:hypothetical protein
MRSSMTQLLVTLLVTGFCSGPAFAASIYKKALPEKKNLYSTSGVIIGGEAGSTFTLLNVRHQGSSKSGLERVLLDLGDHEGKPLKNQLSYYHVSIEKNPSRVVIDLSQVNKSRVSEAALAKLFAKSNLVKSTELMMDPEDNSAKLILNMRGPIAAEVFEMPSNKKASRVVIDLKKAKL